MTGEANLKPAQGGTFGLSGGLVSEVRDALLHDNSALAAALAEPLHPADLADLLQLLERAQRTRLAEALQSGFDPETLSYLDETVRDELIDDIGTDQLGRAVAELEIDDAVGIVADLDDEQREAILGSLPLPDRAAIEQNLAYPDYTAGRLMQRDVVAVPDYWTVGQTIDYLRAMPDLTDEFYDIFLVDPRFNPVGAVPLSNVLRSKRSTPLKELKVKKLHSFGGETDQEAVAFAFRQYGLVSAPVVDADGRLIGVITVDDVVDIIDEEAEDDILKLGGVSETDLFSSPFKTVFNRFPWLVVNLVTAIAASLVIAQFDDQIAKVVALAVLMPIVASMGGNAGTQTLTVSVRALAIKELTPANSLKVLLKESLVGLLNGFLFLLIGVGLAFFWFQDPTLAAVFGAAMLINLAMAGLAGVTIPLIIDKLKLDPAVSSGVFLTTVTDVVGFFSFLGLAVIFL